MTPRGSWRKGEKEDRSKLTYASGATPPESRKTSGIKHTLGDSPFFDSAALYTSVFCRPQSSWAFYVQPRGSWSGPSACGLIAGRAVERGRLSGYSKPCH